MNISKMNNIIVLRGMSSNVVDEAIVILKPNVKLKQSEYNTKGKRTFNDKNKKMIVTKEAEDTINTYIKRLQKESKMKENDILKMKYKFLQICNTVLILGIIIAACIIR